MTTLVQAGQRLLHQAVPRPRAQAGQAGQPRLLQDHGGGDGLPQPRGLLLQLPPGHQHRVHTGLHDA